MGSGVPLARAAPGDRDSRDIVSSQLSASDKTHLALTALWETEGDMRRKFSGNKWKMDCFYGVLR